MSTYSSRPQLDLQNLLQRVVWFSTRNRHARRIYWRTFSADESHSQSHWRGRKLAIISSCLVLAPEMVMDDDAYTGGHSENNIKCIVHDDLGWKNQTTRYILPHHWLYEW